MYTAELVQKVKSFKAAKLSAARDLVKSGADRATVNAVKVQASRAVSLLDAYSCLLANAETGPEVTRAEFLGFAEEKCALLIELIGK